MGIDYKLLRETTKMTVEECAKDIGVAPELLKAWEAGTARPDAIQQKKLFALVKKVAESGQ